MYGAALTNDHMAIGQLQPFLLHFHHVCAWCDVFYQIIGKRHDCVPKTYRWIQTRYEMLAEIFHFYSARSPPPPLSLSYRCDRISYTNEFEMTFSAYSGLVFDISLRRFLFLFPPRSFSRIFCTKHQAPLCVCAAPAATTTVADYYFLLLIFCINRTNEQYRICLYVIYGSWVRALHLLFGRLKPSQCF